MRTLCVLLCIFGGMLTQLDAASPDTVSVVGTVMRPDRTPVDGAVVTLAMTPYPENKIPITFDQTSPDGVFQLVRSPVGQFRRLYLWVEAPYYGRPQGVEFKIDGRIAKAKHPAIRVSASASGLIDIAETAENLTSIVAVEKLKNELGIQDENETEHQIELKSAQLLARCTDIDKPDTMKSVLAMASSKPLEIDDTLTFTWSPETTEKLASLPSNTIFQTAVAANRSSAENFAKYVQGRAAYSPQFVDYAIGLNEKQISPDWFNSSATSKSLHSYLVGEHLLPPSGTAHLVTGKWPTEDQDNFDISKLVGLPVNARKLPKETDIAKWVQEDTAAGKLLIKVRLLEDPAIPENKKTQIRQQLTVPGAAVLK